MAAFTLFKKTKKKPLQPSVAPKKAPAVVKHVKSAKPVESTKPVKPVKSTKSVKTEKPIAAISIHGKEENLIVHPHFSEKTTAGEKQRKYVFDVVLGANKIEIKKLVEVIYKVNVEKVNVLKSFTRTKKWGYRRANFQKTKKVIVTLKEGQKIELGV